MANWWENSPLVEAPTSQPSGGQEWFQSAPLVGEKEPMKASPTGGAMQALDDAARWAANFATFGYADKLAAQMGSLTGIGAPQGVNKYEDLLKLERGRSKAAEENVPLAAKIPLGVAGSLPLIISGGPAGALATAAKFANAPRVAGMLSQVAAPLTTGGRIGAGIAEGGAIGALEATGRDTDITAGTALGAATGGLGSALVSPIISRFTTQRSAATPESLRAAANEQYAIARAQDVVIKPQSFKEFETGAREIAQNFSMDPLLQPRANVAFDRISNLAGKPVSLSELDNLRKILQGVGESTVGSERDLSRRLVNKLDDYVSSIDPAKNVMIGKGEAKTGIEAFNEGRKLWSRQAKSSKIDEIMRNAELSAPQYSASGMENAVRTQFRQLAKNKAEMRGFTAEERKAIEAVAKGGALTNALRMAGKMAPRGVVSGGALMGLTAMNPALGALAYGAGELGRYGAKTRTMGAAESARNLMLSGQPITQRPMSELERALYQASIQAPANLSGGLLGQ